MIGGSRRRGPLPRARSEERRVGEEGRSRWAPDHLKKKKENLSSFDLTRTAIIEPRCLKDCIYRSRAIPCLETKLLLVCVSIITVNLQQSVECMMTKKT